MSMVVNIKVTVNKFGGSIASPSAQYDALVYYADAQNERYLSAPGLFGSLAKEAAYFTRKCYSPYMKEVLFYDYDAQEYHYKIPRAGTNATTVFFNGQFKTKEAVQSFMSDLHYGAMNLDLCGRFNVTFEGNSEVVQEMEEIWAALEKESKS